jgi:hypothetical protein
MTVGFDAFTLPENRDERTVSKGTRLLLVHSVMTSDVFFFLDQPSGFDVPFVRE